MDKQINLYANVFAGARRRRLALWAALACASAVAGMAMVGYSSFRDAKKGLQAQVATATDARAREMSLIEMLKKEMQARQTKLASAKKDESAADGMLLAQDAARPKLLAAIWDALKSWSAPGAALRRSTYENGALTVSGEARGAREAAVALDNLMMTVERTGAWDLGQHEIRAPVAPALHYEFKLTAVPRSAQ